MYLMTKQDFIHYLAQPETLNGHSIADLEKLVQEYPYFQTGRMLYLKNLHNQNSIDYEKNLHITSAYAPSGKVLYNLIKKKPDDRRQMTETKAVEVTVSDISHQASDVLPKHEPTTVPQEIPKPVKEDEFDELQLLEKEMLREAYRTSMTIDLIQGDEVKSQKSKEFSQQPVPKDSFGEASNNSYSFNDWLKVVSGKTPGASAEETAVQKKQPNQLIDDFLLDQTAKAGAKPKAEFYSAETMAKKSIQDDETFVSETLASIYLKQGNLPKALRAYEILVVKYPEKIHIFAPLLEKIKELIKQQQSPSRPSRREGDK